MSKKTRAKIDVSPEAAPVSPSKEKFAALIEAYKTQNPVKYAKKKEELERRLAALTS